MSDHAPEQQESRSSVKLVLNARGESQVEVKVYEGAAAEEMNRIRELAIAQFHETLRAVGKR